MGTIDVSDLLLDPDFVDPLTLIRRTACVDEYGQNQIREAGILTVGSVQPASGKTLQRLPDALRVVGVMSFWLQGKITTDGSGKYPDLISFNGQRYAVQTVFDWTNWGDGFCEGTCVREKPAA